LLYNIFFLRYFLVEVNTVLINVYTVFFEKTWVALQKKPVVEWCEKMAPQTKGAVQNDHSISIVTAGISFIK